MTSFLGDRRNSREGWNSCWRSIRYRRSSRRFCARSSGGGGETSRGKSSRDSAWLSMSDEDARLLLRLESGRRGSAGSDWEWDEERSAAVMNDTSVDGTEPTSTNEAVVSAAEGGIAELARMEENDGMNSRGRRGSRIRCMPGDFLVFMRSSSERRGAGDSLRSALYRARSCCTCRSTSANVGRILGVRSQHMRRISESCWDHTRRSGSSGRMLSSTGGGEVSEMLRKLATDSLTEHEVANSVVVRHRPRQLALGQELDAGNCERVDVHLLREAAVPTHELWRLPSKRPVCNHKALMRKTKTVKGERRTRKG